MNSAKHRDHLHTVIAKRQDKVRYSRVRLGVTCFFSRFTLRQGAAERRANAGGGQPSCQGTLEPGTDILATKTKSAAAKDPLARTKSGRKTSKPPKNNRDLSRLSSIWLLQNAQSVSVSVSE
jgi:hypothetical protein